MPAKYMDSNTPEGWIHMYVAHLLVRCGCEDVQDALNMAAKEAEKAWEEEHSDNLSDNQVIMRINEWHFDYKGHRLFLFNKYTRIYIDSWSLYYWKQRV